MAIIYTYAIVLVIIIWYPIDTLKVLFLYYLESFRIQDENEPRIVNKKRKTLQKTLKSKKVKLGNTEKDASTPERSTVSTADSKLCNYRRFSSRNRRKTDFFSPIETNRNTVNGKEVERVALVSDSYRRVLQFSDKQVVQSLQNAWPQLAGTPERASLTIAEEENKFLAPLVSDGGPIRESVDTGRGRCIRREPMLEVSLWD